MLLLDYINGDNMSEEIERRIAMSGGDKSSITEILDTSNDTVEQIRIYYKSGKILIIDS